MAYKDRSTYNSIFCQKIQTSCREIEIGLAEFGIEKKFIGFQKVFVTRFGPSLVAWIFTNWFRVWVFLFGIRELLKYWFCEEIRLILKFFCESVFGVTLNTE